MTSDHGGSGIYGYAYRWSLNTPLDPGTSSNYNNMSISSARPDGVWYFNIRTVDGVGHWSSNASIGLFKIDTSSPTITGQDAFSIESGTTGNIVSWTPADANPGSYVVYMNGSIFKSNSSWTASSVIDLPIDGLEPGTYNFTIVLADAAGKLISHSVVVTVVGGGTGPMTLTFYIVLIAGGAAALAIAGVVDVKRRRSAKHRSTTSIVNSKQKGSKKKKPIDTASSETTDAAKPSEDGK
jgi:hypothetical protein